MDLGCGRRELCADGAEGCVDVAGQRAHTNWRREGNQCDYQGILDKILTLFPLQNALNPNRQLPQLIFHSSSPEIDYFQSRDWMLSIRQVKCHSVGPSE